jgi:hypothetical protein
MCGTGIGPEWRLISSTLLLGRPMTAHPNDFHPDTDARKYIKIGQKISGRPNRFSITIIGVRTILSQRIFYSYLFFRISFLTDRLAIGKPLLYSDPGSRQLPLQVSPLPRPLMGWHLLPRCVLVVAFCPMHVHHASYNICIVYMPVGIQYRNKHTHETGQQ